MIQVSNQDLLDTINSLPTGIVMLNVEPGYRFTLRAINSAARAQFQTDDNPVGRAIQEWKFPQEILDRMQFNCARCVSTKQAITTERDFKLRDGQTVWSSNTVVPVTNDDDDVTGLFVTTVDITELVELRIAKEKELTALASGFVKICAWCNSVQEADRWVTVDEYLISHPTSETNQSLCPNCI
jgi:PAS domain S-box-containing protein